MTCPLHPNAKSVCCACVASRAGKVGGLSTSKKKRDASRISLAKARAAKKLLASKLPQA